MSGLWTEEDKEAVRALYLKGDSYSVIAKAIGKGYTRRAISGVIHRLNLPKRDDEKSAQMLEVRMENKRVRDAAGKKAPVLVVDGGLGHEPLRLPGGELITMETISDKHCRFPIGLPGTEAFAFCGHPPKMGRPYCEACCKIAFVPVNPNAGRRDADKLAEYSRNSSLLKAFGGGI